MHALTKAQFEQKLTREDLIELLTLTDPRDVEELFALARDVRERRFGPSVYLYGFVYFSTYCRNDCAFCYYRKDNPIARYRKTPAEVLDIACALAQEGVSLIDLTMGEDPVLHEEGFAEVLEMVRGIKEKLDVGVMLSPGVIPDWLIDDFAEAGADIFALYQETHNRALFSKLRLGQSFDGRMGAKRAAKARGMLLEEGLLTGVGESPADIADSILEMEKEAAAQVRVMSFVPQKGSPMENVPSPPRAMEEKTIAALRIYFPNALIPASLDVDGIEGLAARLNAGANVVTSIIPPHTGLRGVAQGGCDAEEGGRTANEVKAILADMGLVPGTAQEFKKELARQRTLCAPEDGT